MDFSGFSQEAFQFLMDIKFHNDRDWFAQHRETYIQALQEPCLALAEVIAPAMLEVDSRYDPRPRHIVSRIHRDVRYSHGIPYKDYMFLSFKPVGSSNSEVLSCFFYLEFDRWGYGAGFYGPVPVAMEAFRSRLLTEGNVFLEALHQPGMERFALEQDRYKRRRAPEGLGEELALWYDQKRFSLYCERPIDDIVTSPRLVEELKQGFSLLKPIVRFVVP